MALTVGGIGLVAASLHCVQSLLVFSLIGSLDGGSKNGGVFTITRTVSVWQPRANASASAPHSMVGNFSVVVQNVPTGFLDARYAIAFFFLLSALFQGGGASLAIEGDLHYGVHDRHRGLTMMARVRLLEYSVSASVMVLAIMSEIGLTDAYVLSCAFVLTMLCMLLGLFADVLCAASERMLALLEMEEPLVQVFGRWVWTVPHVLGWVCMGAVWVPIFDCFLQSQELSEQKAPEFVKAIIGVESTLFLVFGAVQAVALTLKTLTRGSDAERLCAIDAGAETWFVALSFISKTLLGWLIMSPVLAGQVG